MKPRAVRPGNSSVCTTSAQLQQPQNQQLLKSLLTPHRGQEEDNPQHTRHIKDFNYTVHAVTPLKRVWKHCIIIETRINREHRSSWNSKILVSSTHVLYSVKAQEKQKPIYSTTAFQQHAVFAKDNTGNPFWETPGPPSTPEKTCNYHTNNSCT